MPEHRLPVTPKEYLGPTVRETVTVAGRSFILTRPDAVDLLSDHPQLGGTSAAEEYMPYWAHLWPAATLLAEAVLREPSWRAGGVSPPRNVTFTEASLPRGAHAPRSPQDVTALEVGCGLGLPGVAALAAGLRVTFSDYDATALRFAADNARANGFTDFDVLAMDWRWPPEGLRASVVLAADLLYDVELVRPLANLMRRVLLPSGVGLLANGDRVALQALPAALAAEGLSFTQQEVRGDAGPAWLYRIKSQ
jgi:predicted nicotinamide N-methyase